MSDPREAGSRVYRVITPLADNGYVRIYTDLVTVQLNGLLAFFTKDNILIASFAPGEWQSCGLETPTGELFGVDRRKEPREEVTLIPVT